MMLKIKCFKALKMKMEHLCVFLLFGIVIVSGTTGVSRVYQRKTLIYSLEKVRNQIFRAQYIQKSSVNILNQHKTVLNSSSKTLFNPLENEGTQHTHESSVNNLKQRGTELNSFVNEGTQQQSLINTSRGIGTHQKPVEIVTKQQEKVENVRVHRKPVQNLRNNKNHAENLGTHKNLVGEPVIHQKTAEISGTREKLVQNLRTNDKSAENLGKHENLVENLEIHQRFPENVGSPLFLTPYIEKGLIREAQQLSKVRPFVAGVSSYAGLLTVNKTYNSNLFFWFFPSKTNWTNSPITVWLQGGPGGSSLYGLFKENGPYVIEKNHELKLRKYSWHRKCNMIYIDSPVGTGYSFTRNQDGYARNQTKIGEDLYEAMKQFLTMFPQIKSNPFYIAGESYAGKFIPALGYSIHTHNTHSSFKINLQGLLIGNGLTDPENMIPVYADVLYGLGFIDFNQKKIFEKRQEETVRAIRNEDWETATLLYSQLIIGYSFFPYPTFYTNSTGLSTYYNYVNENSAKWYDYERNFVISSKFRRHVHVGNLTRDPGYQTEKFMENDIAKSVINWVKLLVEHYRITFFNGQLDLICAYPLTENFLRKMEWSGARKYRETGRKLWKIDGELAGYVRRSGNLMDILVRNAGHMVPTDQPKWAYHLFNDFIYNRTF